MRASISKSKQRDHFVIRARKDWSWCFIDEIEVFLT